MPVRSARTAPPASDSHRGLNENLARECLELHTVSPAGGYTQADVTNFAKILTGWSIDLRARPARLPVPPLRAHEPGAQIADGPALSPPARRAAWRRCTSSPTTRPPTASSPPSWCGTSSPTTRRPTRSGAIEGVLRDTGGNLGAAAAALVRSTAAWQPASKLRTPQDYVIAALRALDLPPRSWRPSTCSGILAGLGQPFWSAPQPNGWPDRAADWAAPEAMMRRIDWAYGVVRPRSARATRRSSPQANLGPLLRDDTLEAVRRAGSRRDAHDPAAGLTRIPEAMTLQLTRRAALLGLTSAFTLGRASLALAAAATEQRFVVVILRGALDGMSAVVPYGDPRLADLRGEIVPPGPGRPTACWTSAASTACIRRWPTCMPCTRRASCCRSTRSPDPHVVRSHFEAQDCLESGADHRMTSGWLNRAVAALPGAATGGPRATRWRSASRCRCCCAARRRWATGRRTALSHPSPDLYTQIAALNQADRITGPAIAEGLRERGFAAAVLAGDASSRPSNRYAFPALAACGRRDAARRRWPAYRGGGDRRLGHARRRRCRG